MAADCATTDVTNRVTNVIAARDIGISFMPTHVCRNLSKGVLIRFVESWQKTVNEFEVTSRMPDEVRLRALMVGYQSGDLAAFDQLYVLVAPHVRRFLRRKIDDPERVSDLVQETFLQMHRARHTYNPEYPLMPWVRAIARHVWLMHRRAAARRPLVYEDVEQVHLTTRADEDAYADKATLRAALRTLSPERRQPVLWHHVWGFSFREIAEHLGIRTDAAKLRSSRGIADLRSRLRAMDSAGKTHEDE